MAQKNKKWLIKFIFWRALLRAEGFSCSLNVLYEGVGISKLQFLIIKRYKKNFSCIFFFFNVDHQNRGSVSGSGFK